MCCVLFMPMELVLLNIMLSQYCYVLICPKNAGLV